MDKFEIDDFMEKYKWEKVKETAKYSLYVKDGILFSWNFQERLGRLYFKYEDTGIEVIQRNITMPTDFKKLVKEFKKIVCI